jgi:hypothetical protein
LAQNGRVEIGVLPEDGPAQVGSVPLPPGRRHHAEDAGELVAWVTEEPMADSGLAWLALSAMHAQTGLVPVLLRTSEQDVGEELPPFGFFQPADVALLDQMAAGDLLAGMWSDSYDDTDSGPDGDLFTDGFPGLAAAETERLPAARLHEAVTALPSAYLGLVSAGRPADVPAVVGWSAFGVDEPGTPQARSLEVGAVLRSWESRFGARLLQIGNDSILRVLVERPPRDRDQALRLAAEQCAFADEIDRQAAYTVSSVADGLADKPIWTFWWD